MMMMMIMMKIIMIIMMFFFGWEHDEDGDQQDDDDDDDDDDHYYCYHFDDDDSDLSISDFHVSVVKNVVHDQTSRVVTPNGGGEESWNPTLHPLDERYIYLRISLK